MKKSRILTIAISTLMLILVSCGSSYNTEFAPPSQNAQLTEVFPQDIGGTKADIQPIKEVTTGIAYEANYNDLIKITVMQFKEKSEADAFFKAKVVPLFDKMTNHSRAQVNGKWYAKGSDNTGEHYAWVNQNWVLGIYAKDDAEFSKAVAAFNYISE